MPTDSLHVFLSHASQDDDFVNLLRKKLEDHGINVWVDSRNLRGGDKLSPEIETAIRNASNFLVVISPNTINSDWVFDEIKIAEQVEKENPDFRAIPLMLPGIKPKALKRYFSEEPAGEMIETEVGKLDEQLPHILAALGYRAPDHDLPKADEVENKPMAELLLELSEPSLTTDNNGAEQLSARAELTYTPHDISKEREVKSRLFRFIAPIGKNEQGEIRWYLEQYLLWPVGSFRDRAEKTESQLAEWGKALFTTSLGQDVCREPLTAWQKARNEVERRFSVQVDASTLEDDQEAKLKANEAASRLQSLPWELLHDDAYLSDSANPVRIRRRLPNYKQQVPNLTNLPIRILLLSPRPEEKDVRYIDHRASALPLVEAVESLGDLVQLKILNPPTLGALEKELHSARNAKTPYHVLHFDGHGIYDKQHGLGALCFENPNDANKLEGRRNELVHADKLAKLLKDFRIPVVFLEACQTAKSEESPNASVAASLLEEGVTSVVAMSHSVLVETAKRFVTEFYQALAKGQRVGAAMLAGQKELMQNTYRLPIQGAGDFHLQDWFVPILYQEQHDPQLFAWIPSEAAQKMQKQQRQTRLGKLPKPPEHTFIGRSRDLLKAERLLEQQPYVVIRGQGGAGKTTVAVELTRWLVKSRRFDRCAFVSVEEYTHDSTVVEVLLQQLVNANYNLAAEYGSDVDKALQAIRRTLENERTLIVIDNMESLLADTTNKQAVLDMLARLTEAKLLFTTREALPEPFHHKAREIELGELSLNDAKSLVMQVMNNEGLSLRHDDAGNTPQEVDNLVQSVGCHARALVLLARELAQRGVIATTANVREIMEDLERRYPGQRENSLFASVELSLQRLSPVIRQQIVGLAVFQGGGYYQIAAHVIDVDNEKASEILQELIRVGLAQFIGEHGYIRFDPGLPIYLDLSLSTQKRDEYRHRWLVAMASFIHLLYNAQFEAPEFSTQLTKLSLSDLMCCLTSKETTIDEYRFELAGMVESLLEFAGEPSLLKSVMKYRGKAASTTSEWDHMSFFNMYRDLEYLMSLGKFEEMIIGARNLLQQCQRVELSSYPEAKYDLGMSYLLMGKALARFAPSEECLSFLSLAKDIFEDIGGEARRMLIVTLSEYSFSLLNIGRFNEAKRILIDTIDLSEEIQNHRQSAYDKKQLATALLHTDEHEKALGLFHESLKVFERLDEPCETANIYHRLGMVYRVLKQYQAAENYFRKALPLLNKFQMHEDEAGTLCELGTLYMFWGKVEQSINFYRKSIDLDVEIKKPLAESLTRDNLAMLLINNEEYSQARIELNKAIICKTDFGSASKPWVTWSLLSQLDRIEADTTGANITRQKALDTFLLFRKEGGENNTPTGNLALSVGSALQQGGAAEAEQVIGQLLEQDGWKEAKKFLHALLAIVVGGRSLTLAEDEDLHYEDAAELVLLLESLA